MGTTFIFFDTLSHSVREKKKDILFSDRLLTAVAPTAFRVTFLTKNFPTQGILDIIWTSEEWLV